ncbi:MAG: hypothetical protein ACYSU0_18495 [Planctomycetota bacterium]
MRGTPFTWQSVAGLVIAPRHRIHLLAEEEDPLLVVKDDDDGLQARPDDRSDDLLA